MKLPMHRGTCFISIKPFFLRSLHISLDVIGIYVYLLITFLLYTYLIRISRLLLIITYNLFYGDFTLFFLAVKRYRKKVFILAKTIKFRYTFHENHIKENRHERIGNYQNRNPNLHRLCRHSHPTPHLSRQRPFQDPANLTSPFKNRHGNEQTLSLCVSGEV